MKKTKQIKNWWIDALMMVAYLFCFYLEFTGVVGHQWLGVGIGVLVVIHTLLHWDWVVLVTKRFFTNVGAKSRWYYMVDVLILMGLVVILETGLVISTWVNFDLPNYIAWLDIHTYASYITLALLVFKIGIHWRWVVNTTGRIFGTQKKQVSVGRLAPVPVPVKINREAIDRRRFLGLMGVVGLGSTLAVINVLRENAFFSDATSQVSAMSLADSTSTSTALDATTEPTMESTKVAAEENALETVATATTDATSVATAEPTTGVTSAAVAACTVRCPKGCSFPGRCRRYTDQNNNGLCDLGECL
jgi:hypothetical protein